MRGERVLEKQAFLFQVATDHKDVLHQGTFMEQGGEQTTRVDNLGAISAINLPASWHKFEQNTSSGRATTFAPKGNDAPQITNLEHTRPVDPNTTQIYKDLLAQKAPETLYAEGFNVDAKAAKLLKSISPILGESLVGDNQISNPVSDPGDQQPAFHLQSAKLQQVAGKNVLAVSGWFTQNDALGHPKMGPDGPLKRFYQGVFSPPDKKTGSVDELYVLADSDAAFAKGQSVFKSSLSTIKWK